MPRVLRNEKFCAGEVQGNSIFMQPEKTTGTTHIDLHTRKNNGVCPSHEIHLDKTYLGLRKFSLAKGCVIC